MMLPAKQKQQALRYAPLVRYPGATSKSAADEAAAIMNQAYQSPLYQKGEPFRGEIVFKRGAEYVSRE